MPSRRITEDSLIRMIQRTVKSRGRVRLGIGDDAAVLKDGTVARPTRHLDSGRFLAILTECPATVRHHRSADRPPR